MKKHFLVLATAMMLVGGNAIGQEHNSYLHCGTDEVRKRLLETHPEILERENAFNKQVLEGLKHIDFSHLRTTSDSTSGDTVQWFDIPIVCHFVHDYGIENLPDTEIYHDLLQWNTVYAKRNWDTSLVIPPFRKWIGNMHIRLHLATKDRFGNPTKGITRHRSYLTYNGNDESKLDDWPNTSYLNIWFVNGLAGQGGFQPAAYAYFPSTAASLPFWDGIICIYQYISTDKTINHECGHVMSLLHVWGNNNAAAAGTCVADAPYDMVDDTPPTIGHLSCSNADLYDTVCAAGYYMTYPSVQHPGTDSIVYYVDTTNTQNIMDYSYCSKMFTIGQSVRAANALNDSTASRNNLWSPRNLAATGALDPTPDMKPIPEFAATNVNGVYNVLKAFEGSAPPRYFIGSYNASKRPNARIRFIDNSWNDTVAYINWTFSNNAIFPTLTTRPDYQYHRDTVSVPTVYGKKYQDTIVNGFMQPGWVTVTMQVTDTSGQSAGRPNNVGDSTFTNAVFVADSVGVNALTYYEEFNPAGDAAKWPTFNYYKNEFLWQIDTTVGFDDHFSMKYAGYDAFINPSAYIFRITGTPGGDYDDLFSVPFDLTGFTESDSIYLNFMYSGASRSSNTLDVNDSMQVQASADGGDTWTNLLTMSKSILENQGGISTSFVPTSQSDWSPASILMPAALRTDYTLVRFRYFPGNGQDGQSSGNNFYLDRVSFNPWTASAGNLHSNSDKVVVAPNPTSGDASVIINSRENGKVSVIVSDVTGKVVFRTSESVNGKETRITIPKASISEKGVYIVSTTTPSGATTSKLLVD